MRKFQATACFCVFSLAFSFLVGCANYRIGTTLPEHLKTVYVETLRNQTGEPQIETTITAAILREFQRDGQLKVVDREDADVLVSGTLKVYKLEPMRYDRNSPKTTLEYRAIVHADILAMDQVEGRRLVRQSVSGSTKMGAAGDLVTARRNALPDVAEDLAGEIVDAVISAWTPSSAAAAGNGGQPLPRKGPAVQ